MYWAKYKYENFSEMYLCDVTYNVIVIGDFNIDWLSNITYSSWLKSAISLKNIASQITHPTVWGSSLIDYKNKLYAQ